MLVLIKEPPRLLCARLGFGSLRCLWGCPGQCPVVIQLSCPGSNGSGSPWCSFWFHFLFIFFSFLFTLLTSCTCSSFGAWKLHEVTCTSSTSRAFFSLLASMVPHGQVKLFKNQEFMLGCWKLWSPGLKSQWGLLTDPALRLCWVWLCPCSKEDSSLECAELGWSQVPAQLHGHEHLWQFVWHRMSSVFLRDRKAVCVVAWYQSLEYWTFNTSYSSYSPFWFFFF